MPKRTAGRAQPAHADVWFHAPVWTSRKQRLAVAGVIIAAVLGSVGGAGVTARRVDAAEQHPAGSSSSSQVPGYPTVVGAPLAGSPGVTSPIGLPPTELPTSPSHSGGPTPAGPLAPQLAGDGIPAVALDAYRKAAAAAPAGCDIPWPLLAAIGRVESDHGRFANSQLYADGTSAPHVIGIPLNGNGTALIRDTDHGALDGDTVYDRAVGPMQFIPSTWATWGIDGNGDGVADPFNIYDASEAAADYLCSAGGNLATSSGQIRAVLAYNHSSEYLATVLSLEQVYASGVPGVDIPLLPSIPKPPGSGALPPLPPPVDPGRPLGLGALHKPKQHPSQTSHPKPPTGPGTPPSSTPTAPGIPSGGTRPSTPSTPPTCPTDTTPPGSDTAPKPDPSCPPTSSDPGSSSSDPSPTPTSTTSSSAPDTSTSSGSTVDTSTTSGSAADTSTTSAATSS
jgi:hypothetical protein